MFCSNARPHRLQTGQFRSVMPHITPLTDCPFKHELAISYSGSTAFHQIMISRLNRTILITLSMGEHA